MKVYEILSELVIFAKERGFEYEENLRSVLVAADRHLEALRRAQEKRRRRLKLCEFCGGESTNGILCTSCLGAAPAKVRHAFRDACGIEGVREAAKLVRGWIKNPSKWRSAA